MCTGFQELDNYIIVLYFRLYFSGQDNTEPALHKFTPTTNSAAGQNNFFQEMLNWFEIHSRKSDRCVINDASQDDYPNLVRIWHCKLDDYKCGVVTFGSVILSD